MFASRVGRSRRKTGKSFPALKNNKYNSPMPPFGVDLPGPSGFRAPRELRDLGKTKQKGLDLSDLPEVRDWAGAVGAKFYRPIKKPLTFRVDADVLASFKSQGKGYQTRINKILRFAMMNQAGRRRS